MTEVPTFVSCVIAVRSKMNYMWFTDAGVCSLFNSGRITDIFLEVFVVIISRPLPTRTILMFANFYLPWLDFLTDFAVEQPDRAGDLVT